MATDYDAPRKSDDETTSLEEVKEGTQTPVHASADMDESDAGTSLLSADIEHEELEVVVVPKQEDEFTCMECFIVKHRTQMAPGKKQICLECAS